MKKRTSIHNTHQMYHKQNMKKYTEHHEKNCNLYTTTNTVKNKQNKYHKLTINRHTRKSQSNEPRDLVEEIKTEAKK